MTVRVTVAPSVLSWALDVTSADPANLRNRFKVDQWLTSDTRPTLKQLQEFARATGIAFGYFLLPQPPAWKLPMPDFREGFDGPPTPSANLIAVLSQSERRQDWYRDYVLGLGAEPLNFVGSAADLAPPEAAARMRATLDFEVHSRQGTWADTRKALLRAFEAIGGLTIATSMVGNNTRRPLDENEFRGFALVDDIAPLVFVNTHQTLNGQIFTLVHELAHVWLGTSGIGNEDHASRVGPMSSDGATPSRPKCSCREMNLRLATPALATWPCRNSSTSLHTRSAAARLSFSKLFSGPELAGSTTSTESTTRRSPDCGRSARAVRAAAATTTTTNPSASANGFPAP